MSPDDSATSADAIGPALGRVPSGLFIVTTRDERDRPMGFLGSFVQQVALDPPTVCVAISTEREHLDAVRSAGRFGVSVLGEADKGLMKPFFKKPEDGSPFDDVAPDLRVVEPLPVRRRVGVRGSRRFGVSEVTRPPRSPSAPS